MMTFLAARQPESDVMLNAAFVSCDIVGHSAIKDIEVQQRRIAGINAIVAASLAECAPHAFWASGGDGGHVLFCRFCREGLYGAALQLMKQLREWSEAEDVPLRVSAHYGPVDRFDGADGRTQFVGDGINFAGRLLEIAPPTGIAASSTFERVVSEADTDLAAEFDQPRFVFLKAFGLHSVRMLSLGGIRRSVWGDANHDRIALTEALNQQQAWDVLYFAKRIMQGNAFDDDAEETLEYLGPHLLVHENHIDDASPAATVANPFLAPLDIEGRIEVVRTAQLVERRLGEHICDAGDRGDAMFIVLRGEIGVFHRDDDAETVNPVAVVRRGEIVGELALALGRPRTATLIATQDSAMLSMSGESLRPLLRTHPEVATSLDRFVTSRILEYACHNSTLLLGPDGSGPISGLPTKRPWERLLRFAERIRFVTGDPAPVSLNEDRFRQDGIYLLVSGRLRSLSYPEKVLSSEDLPLLYVDLPGWISLPDHAYRVEEADATILRIAKDAFVGRTAIIDQVARTLLNELAKREFFHFDVFMSYTFDDFDTAQKWRKALEAAGLRVYMEEARTGHYFRERIEAAILESLTLVALVSAHTMSRPLENNWVRQEIDFRIAAFEQKTARVFPVRLTGGKPELLADGYTVIETRNREEDAIQELNAGIRAVKVAQVEPPYSLSRKLALRLQE